METKVVDITVGKRTSDTTFDLIYKSYFGEVPVKLTTKQEEIKTRWNKAWDLLCSFKSSRSVVKVLVNDFDISEKTAYMDIECAERLYQDPYLGNKERHRAKVNRWIDNLIEKLFEDKEYDAIEKLIGRYIKNNNTEHDEHPLAEFLKNMRPIKIEFSSDPEILKKQASDLMKDVSTDVDYTDIADNESEAS